MLLSNCCLYYEIAKIFTYIVVCIFSLFIVSFAASYQLLIADIKMSFTNLMTSIHEEVRMHPATTPVYTPVATPVSTPVVGTSKSPKVIWTREMERKLLDLLLEQVQLGRKGEGGFRKEAWTAIEKKFNEDLKLNLGKENFKNKLKTWKAGYRVMKELRNTSGFAWNETTQCMDAEESVWDELLKVIYCSRYF